MPSPMTTLSRSTRWKSDSAARRSWLSGSAYIQLPSAAARMAASALGEGPNRLSLAPRRARNGRPRVRSCASGPTNGTKAGRLSTRAVKRGRDMIVFDNDASRVRLKLWLCPERGVTSTAVLREALLALAELRRVYARQMLALANALADTRLEDACAAVPRESFLGEGPWRILTPWSPYTTVPERDPALIYQDVVVALDEERGVNNGSPSLHARWMHLVSPRRGERIAHVRAGAGHYSAICGELRDDER